MKTWSPLRYPGGKGQLYNFVLTILESNDLIGCDYIEPYAGGAGVAIRLLIENKVKTISINDYDRSIYAFWHSVLYETENLIGLISRTEINIDNWYIQKSIQLHKDNVSLLELGFSTLFLNRTNHSGILKAGPIGGKSQSGEYKIDCRFNKAKLIDLIKSISQLKSRIYLYNLDGEKFLNLSRKPSNFYFIDPPYYKKGKDLYANFFSHEQHLSLSCTIKNILENNRYIITYDDCPEIEIMYDYLMIDRISLNYSLNTKRIANEILMVNNISYGGK